MEREFARVVFVHTLGDGPHDSAAIAEWLVDVPVVTHRLPPAAPLAQEAQALMPNLRAPRPPARLVADDDIALFASKIGEQPRKLRPGVEIVVGRAQLRLFDESQ